MLKNSKFAIKIALLPSLAAVSFVIILAISWIAGRNGTQLLTNIENGYYSSLELGRVLEEELDGIRRAFEDAAALADPEYMDDAAARRQLLMENLGAGKNNVIVDVAPLNRFQNEFEQYYDAAQTSTSHLIDGTGGDDIYEGLQNIAEQYAGLKSQIQAIQLRDKADVATAFSTAQSSQRTGTLVLVVVVVLSLLLLVATSVFIIRMASQSIRTTVVGINALAAGDLSQEFRAHSNDEMGQMVNRVGHVTLTINDLTTEVQTLIDAVRAGKLQTRGKPDRFEGAYAKLIGNINELIDAFVAPIEVTAQYVERISRGDIPPQISETYHGDFNQTKENLNVLVSAMNGLVEQTDSLTSAAKAGDLDKRGDHTQFSGVWRELVVGINETLDAVTEPLQEVSEVMSAIAHGNLTRTIDTHYQGAFAKLKSDINTTIARLTDVISSIKGAGDAVSAASSEIAHGNQSLRLRTDDQASSLKNTADSMKDMIASVRQNAENAHRANETVLEASDKAKRGGNVVGEAVCAMDAINASSKKIADIINVINEIAFQTNLLALNAAVEAARAGDEGRGFAVVASEVRNLAGRSAMAAKEINDLIKDSVGKVKEGSRLVHESGQTLKEIVGAVMDVTDIVSKIAVSSQEQTINIEGVNEAIADMDTMTKKNAALAVEAARSSDVMGEEATRLTRTTSFFTMEAGLKKLEKNTVKPVHGDGSLAGVVKTAQRSNSASPSVLTGRA